MVEDDIFVGEFARQREAQTFTFLQVHVEAIAENVASVADAFAVVVDGPVADRSEAIAGYTYHQLPDLF